jgi:hypothetical protein
MLERIAKAAEDTGTEGGAGRECVQGCPGGRRRPTSLASTTRPAHTARLP